MALFPQTKNITRNLLLFEVLVFFTFHAFSIIDGFKKKK